MSKDPFQILADEITLIRSEIEKLQRTSLNKDEAKTLHDHVTTSVDELRKAAPALHDLIDRKLTSAMAVVKDNTATAADESAKGAVMGAHAESVKAAKMLLRDAETARKGAWRTFGHFGAWIALTAALCLFVGSLATMAVQGRADAVAFGKFTGLYCSSADGRKFTANDGKEYCAVPID